MASFSKFITKVKKVENGYSNLSSDRGKETYMGIVRFFWLKWAGWSYIDKYKAQNGTIKRFTIFPELDSEVDRFYLNNYWTLTSATQLKSNKPLTADSLKSQEVAELLVDWKINGGYSAEKFQSILKGLGQNIVIDGIVGNITINAANAVNQKTLFDEIMKMRKSWYEQIVSKDATQRVNWQGWLNRLAEFKPPAGSLALGGVLVLTACGAFFFLTSTSNVPKR